MADASETSAALNGKSDAESIIADHDIRRQARTMPIEQVEKANYDRWKSITPATRAQSMHLDLVDDRNVARYRLEIDDVMRNKNRRNVMVGMPNELLLKYGLKNAPIYINANDIVKMAYPYGYLQTDATQNRHNLGFSVIKNLVYQLAEPVGITENTLEQQKKHKEKGTGSRIIFTEWIDKNNNPIIVPITIGAGNRISIPDASIQNVVNTAFGAEEAYLKALEGVKVLYPENKKDISALFTESWQTSLPESSSDDIFAPNIYEDDVFVKQNAENVKKFELRDDYSGGGGNGYDGYYVETWNGTAWEVDTEQFNEEEADIRYSLKNYKEYLTEQAKEEYSEDKRFKNWVHKDLAFISAASWDGVHIPAEELMSIPKIQAAETLTRVEKTSLELHPPGENVLIDEKRERLAERLLDADHGSAVFENGKIKKINGVEQFTGPVEQGKHACIVIGRPAGGKSRVFANPLSNRYKARIIDSDVVKPWLDGFEGGYGAGYVQEESSYIMELALEKAIARGDNIIVPKIGGNSIVGLAEKMKRQGYTVDLYYNEVSEGTSIMRAASRFAEEGRYLSLSYLKSIGQKATRSFKDFAESGIFNYAEWRNNDVRIGEEPKLIWKTGEAALELAFEKYAGLGGRNTKLAESGRRNQKSLSGDIQSGLLQGTTRAESTSRETKSQTDGDRAGRENNEIDGERLKRNQLRGLHKTNAAILAESEGTTEAEKQRLAQFRAISKQYSEMTKEMAQLRTEAEESKGTKKANLLAREAKLASVEINTVKEIGNDYEYYNIILTLFDLKQRYLKNQFIMAQRLYMK